MKISTPSRRLLLTSAVRNVWVVLLATLVEKAADIADVENMKARA